MAYIAVRGGREAIENAAGLLRWRRDSGGRPPIGIDQIRSELHLLVDRVMGEGSLWAPDLAALAVKQAAGDTLEAAFLLRAWRSTLPRVCDSLPVDTGRMRMLRRISAAFREIPGGQFLGPTPDYTLRLLDMELMNQGVEERDALLRAFLGSLGNHEPLPLSFPRVTEILRREGLLAERPGTAGDGDAIMDITREAMTIPAPRSASLQTLARGETGGMLALAYSNMRGYGAVHPTIGELRVGWVPVEIVHPLTGETEPLGEVLLTEAEVIAHHEEGEGGPRFTLGYGLCFGHNETKAISMAVLDRAMQSASPRSPSEDQEFVLQHVDGIEASGFCNHYKLAHYVSFASSLDRLRTARGRADEGVRP